MGKHYIRRMDKKSNILRIFGAIGLLIILAAKWIESNAGIDKRLVAIIGAALVVYNIQYQVRLLIQLRKIKRKNQKNRI